MTGSNSSTTGGCLPWGMCFARKSFHAALLVSSPLLGHTPCAARPPYAWVVFDDYHPPVGPGNPFHIPANFLKKQTPEEPASVGLQRCSRALRDAALGVVVMRGAAGSCCDVGAPGAAPMSSA